MTTITINISGDKTEELKKPQPTTKAYAYGDRISGPYITINGALFAIGHGELICIGTVQSG